MLFCMIEMVINADPEAPCVLAASNVHHKELKPRGFVLAFNLEAKHDPQVAQHFRAILERLIELEPKNSDQSQSMRDAIAACIASDEVEVQFL